MAKAKKKPLREEKGKPGKKTGVPGRKHHAVALCLILIVTSGVFANSLQSKFIWDDRDLILENHYIKDWGYFPLALTKDFFYRSHDEDKIGYYRPLITFSYMLDYSIWKLNPLGYHLTNLIVHTANCILIYLIVWFLSSSVTLSLLSSLLFALHPIHTESVSWISGRTDVIAGFFFFSSLLLYMYGEKAGRWKYYVFSLILFACALLSKEMVMTLPLLIMLYDYCFVAGREIPKLRGRVKYWAGYFLLAGMYLVVRFLVFKVGTGNSHVEELNRLYVILTFGKGFLYYLLKLLMPFNLSAYVILRLGSFTQIGVWAGILVIVALAIAGLRSRDDRLSFGIGFFLISLLPLTNLIPINSPVDMDFPLAERFIYIPSFGFCLLLGIGGEKMLRLNKSAAGALVFFLLIFYSYNTFARNRVWRDEEVFYRVTAEVSPRSSVIHNNLGVVFKSKGRYDEAVEQFKKAIELYPQLYVVYNNLGNVYQDKGSYQEALMYYQEALRLRPDHAKTHNNLGNLYENLGRYDLAEQELKIALHLRPDLAESHSNLGNVYLDKKLYGEAIKEFQEALRVKPDFAEAHNNLGSVYHDLRREDEAVREFQAALQCKPDFAEPYYNLGNLYQDQSRYGEAVQAYQQAVKIKPLFTEAYFNLGIAYMQMNLYREAEQAYLNALKCRPNYAPVHRNLGVLYFYHLKNRERARYHFQMTLMSEPNQAGADAVKRALRELVESRS